MLIKFFGELDIYKDIKLEVSNIQQVIAGIKHTYGQELYDNILEKEYKYILLNSKDENDVIALHPDLVTMNFVHYDTLYIIPDIEGEGQYIVALIAGVSVAAVAASATLTTIAFVVNVALAIALSALMQLLSPTPHFVNDPSVTQSSKRLESNLFNGAPNIREQGGSVPIVYGHTIAGGVLISAGISTEEITL